MLETIHQIKPRKDQVPMIECFDEETIAVLMIPLDLTIKFFAVLLLGCQGKRIQCAKSFSTCLQRLSNRIEF